GLGRGGVTLAGVQHVAGLAVGGGARVLVCEGARRFQIVVRLPDGLRNDLEALENLPVSLPQAGAGGAAVTVPLRQLATFSFAEGPNQISRELGKRRV